MFTAPNDIFSNKDKKIYISKNLGVIEDSNYNQIQSFEEPFYLGKINYQPLSGKDLQAYISVYGETKKKLARAFLDLSYRGKFKEFDLAYLYGANPTDEEVYGQNANYTVKSFVEQNIRIMVIFEEIIKEWYYARNKNKKY